jgi:hypothetical protein
VSWLISRDVAEGRDHLNFSEWGSFTARDRARLSAEAAEEVSEGGMPLKAYLFLHREAQMRSGDVDTLRAWALTEKAAETDGVSR